MPTDPTRDRVLAAAKAEFAMFGIAGARIDRIAKAARTSKERVYAHFDSKEALYRVISDQELTAVAEAARMDPADLPAYAGRIHDYFAAHPERYRLMRWGQLELGSDGGAIRLTMEHKVKQLRQAQESGRLDAAWDPLDVLVLVHQIAMAWAGQQDLVPEESVAFGAARRAAVVKAVQRLFPAAGD
jgi:AcrR family transcriptional regulator